MTEWNGAFVQQKLNIQGTRTKGFEELLGLALRKNKKRAHLLVSKVLGKHIPVNPQLLLCVSQNLAFQISSAVYYPENTNDKAYLKKLHQDSLEELLKAIEGGPGSIAGLAHTSGNYYTPNVTVFGYAETATGLGATVAEALNAPYYINSTRYPLPHTKDYGSFEEEHSHATSHHITPQNDSYLNDPKQIIVLVDDELTTGNTIMNTIRLFESKASHPAYYVATLTDLRDEKARKQLRDFASEMKVKIKVFSILSAELEVPQNSVQQAETVIEEIKNTQAEVHPSSKNGTVLKLTHTENLLPLSKGFKDVDFYSLHQHINNLVNQVAPVHKEKVLVLGLEENMYAPSLFARLLKKHSGIQVFFSATTRSPVVAYKSPDYAIEDRIKYHLHSDQETPRFVYNVGESFDRIIVLTESHEQTQDIEDLIEQLQTRVNLIEILTPKVDVSRLPEPLTAPAFGSYEGKDVLWLLKDLSDAELEAPIEDREEAIQSGGAHYAESLPVEYVPSAEYQELFASSLEENKKKLAEAVAFVSEQVFNLRDGKPVLVSLARAGTPIGVLMKRYLEQAYSRDIAHYAVSIVRGKGIDANALRYIATHHNPADVIFVDGWTGKGAIAKELTAALNIFTEETGIKFPDDLAVLADPGSCVTIYGTREDYLIPSACLNSTVSGLVSRTVLNEDFIGPDDFHGAKYYAGFASVDYSNYFVDVISAEFDKELSLQARKKYNDYQPEKPDWSGWKMVEEISETYGIHNVNLVKPGVGETTRVLLRRVPWLILIRPEEKRNLKHVLLLAEQRGVTIEERTDLPYACVGLIHPEYTKGATGFDGGSVS